MKAIVLLSGGIDSATVLYMALKRNYDINAVTFDYESTESMEIKAARAIAQAANVEHRIYEIPFYKELKGSPSSSSRMIIDKNDGISAAYVPARNIVFFGMAAALAETGGAQLILSGHNKGDNARFPDTDSKFLRTFNRLIKLGLKNKDLRLKVKMPLRNLNKIQIVRKAIRLKVPLHLTWSCYNDGVEPCGLCYGCISRKEAFRALGEDDPWKRPS